MQVVDPTTGEPKMDEHGRPIRAQKISLSPAFAESVNPNNFRLDLIDLFRKINEIFTRSTGTSLWPKFKVIETGEAVSGSSHYLFMPKFLDQFVKAKPKMGDIDVMIPRHSLEKLWRVLVDNSGKRFGKFTLVGTNKREPGSFQIHYLFSYTYPSIKAGTKTVNIQIDFEGQDFSNGEPTEWARISHASSFEDLVKGIKGVFCVYLWRAAAKVNTEVKDSAVLTPKSPIAPTPKGTYKGGPKRGQPKIQDVRIRNTGGEPITKFSMGTISVDKGYRDKYRPEIDPSTGEPVMVDLAGKKLKAYKELPTESAAYITDIRAIKDRIYPGIKTEGDFRNFVQNCKWVGEYPAKKIAKIFNAFVDLCFKPGEAQELENILGNKNAAQDDRKAKLAACQEFLNIVGPKLGDFLQVCKDRMTSMSNPEGTYYQHYGERGESSGDDDTGVAESLVSKYNELFEIILESEADRNYFSEQFYLTPSEVKPETLLNVFSRYWTQRPTDHIALDLTAFRSLFPMHWHWLVKNLYEKLEERLSFEHEADHEKREIQTILKRLDVALDRLGYPR